MWVYGVRCGYMVLGCTCMVWVYMMWVYGGVRMYGVGIYMVWVYGGVRVYGVGVWC